MPAGPVGGVWAAGVWADTVWEIGVWGDAGEQTAFQPPFTADAIVVQAVSRSIVVPAVSRSIVVPRRTER